MLEGYVLFKSKIYPHSYTFDISIILKSFRKKKLFFRSKIKLKDKKTKSKEAKSKR